MLTITVPGQEIYNRETQEFSTVGDFELDLEHSLATLSKWESKFEKPFLNKDEKTQEEIVEYIKLMILSKNVPEDIFDRFSEENLEAIRDYINSKNTATWFGEDQQKAPTGRIITAELIYYSMFSLSVPLECEHWHLNRLFTLIRIFDAEQSTQSKRSPKDAAAQRRALNEQRKAQLKTRG